MVVRNRLVMAPLTTYSSHADGTIDAAELDFLRRRAAGGFGVVMTAACYVHPSGHAFEGQWSCADNRYLPSLAQAARAIHEGGALAVLQIHHGGRQCPTKFVDPPWSASAIPSERPQAPIPREMTESDIDEIIDSFVAAAGRAQVAGFDGVEIHGANTYLIQQFVSPHSNRRNDGWGLDRLKFPLCLVDRVLDTLGPRFMVGYRFSPEETETPGIRWADTERLLNELCQRPLSWLHVSLSQFQSGSLVGEFQDPILARIADVIKRRVPLIGVGGIKSNDDIVKCLALGADLVAVGRAAITEPEFASVVETGTPRLKLPAEGAAESLTIPEGLFRRFVATPGWIDFEERSSVSP